MTADTAESLLREFARKQTNKDRAAEELAKSAATLLPLLSDVLHLTIQGGCRLCKSQGRLQEKWIKCMVVGRMVLFQVRVCLVTRNGPASK